MAETTQEAINNLNKELKKLKESILTEYPFLRKLPGLYNKDGRLRFFICLAYISIINVVTEGTAFIIDMIIKHK